MGQDPTLEVNMLVRTIKLHLGTGHQIEAGVLLNQHIIDYQIG